MYAAVQHMIVQVVRVAKPLERMAEELRHSLQLGVIVHCSVNASLHSSNLAHAEYSVDRVSSKRTHDQSKFCK